MCVFFPQSTENKPSPTYCCKRSSAKCESLLLAGHFPSPGMMARKRGQNTEFLGEKNTIFREYTVLLDVHLYVDKDCEPKKTPDFLLMEKIPQPFTVIMK